MDPVVGVTRCSRIEDYLASVEKAGARTRVLEVTESPRAVLEQVDAVLLTGGGDVDPVLYGEPRHPSVADAEPGRDEFEISLARLAIGRDVPLLAICRGAQVLNVAFGGTLVQDIPSAIPTRVAHSVREPRDRVAHAVRVARGSHLEGTLGSAVNASSLCRVNSRHHQSIARIGAGLTASATAEDGVIEAVEAPAARFCVGVQWHPENFWRTGEFSGLFDALVSAARERLAARTPEIHE